MDGGKAPALEGVEGRLKNLRLADAEKKGVRIGRARAFASRETKLQAVGKILSERPAKKEYVKKTLGNIWCPLSGIECKEMGKNRFLFTFQEESTQKKAVEDGPWMYQKNVIVMEKFVPNKTIDEYEFKTIPIWVRAFGIPMGAMSKETGDLIGDRIGETLDVDLDDTGDASGEYMRIKVRIDINNPIARYTELIIERDEEEDQEMAGDTSEVKTITFKYEYLPDFCYSCGLIGHTEMCCPTRTRREGARNFGPWLRAVILRPSSSEEKSHGSNEGEGFWMTSSLGGRISSDGSWRKPDSELQPNKLIERVEEKDGTSPLMITKGEGPNLDNKEMQHNNVEKQGNSFNEEKVRIQSENKSKEMIKTESKERKQETHVGQGTDEDKGTVEKKQRTFKRQNRQGVRPHERKPASDQEMRKRTTELMEIEQNTGELKRARMEIDEENEELTKNTTETENARLQGQPGGSR